VGAAPLAVPQSAAANPPGYAAAARFLEQASWGPTPDSIARVQALGFPGWLDEQFQATPSQISAVPIPPPPANPSFRPVQDEFFYNAVNGQDQLRTRVAFALHQVWVVSAVKINVPDAMLHYLRLLQQDAFGNYLNLMRDITLGPAMGHYLDMVNNDKPNPVTGRGANENYAREILQLFTLGLEKLNADGTTVKDANGLPVPTYDQEDIEELARAFTGWTYPVLPGATPKTHNPAAWSAPMVAVESVHDTDPKAILGESFPAHQTASDDLEHALYVIFQHPNLGPFVARRLIQHLVTGAPSPEYVARVAGVFNDNGQGVRGDLKAVVRAVLLDPEARAADAAAAAPGEGHLREPALLVAGLLRALGAQVEKSNGLAPAVAQLGQNVYYPPTVFSYYTPNYAPPGADTPAPEFQLLSPSAAMLRADLVNSLVYGKVAGVTVDLTPFAKLAGDPTAFKDAFSRTFLRGQMPDDVWTTVMKAVAVTPGDQAKAQAAAYLLGSSAQYQVER
jgi:uncharacterized protein (DUF1800 family)